MYPTGGFDHPGSPAASGLLRIPCPNAYLGMSANGVPRNVCFFPGFPGSKNAPSVDGLRGVPFVNTSDSISKIIEQKSIPRVEYHWLG